MQRVNVGSVSVGGNSVTAYAEDGQVELSGFFGCRMEPETAELLMYLVANAAAVARRQREHGERPTTPGEQPR